jgi:hypothetical protein
MERRRLLLTLLLCSALASGILSFPADCAEAAKGGPLLQIPPLPGKARPGLALIYEAALGAWLFPIMNSVFILGGEFLLWVPPFLPECLLWMHRPWTHGTGFTTFLASLIVAGLSAILFYRALCAADNPGAATRSLHHRLRSGKLAEQCH